MDTRTRVQTQIGAVYISHNPNTLGKGMNPSILSLAMGKLYGRLCSLTLLWQPDVEKENSIFKPVKLFLKIDLVSYPVLGEGVGKIYSIRKINRIEKLEVRFCEVSHFCR